MAKKKEEFEFRVPVRRQPVWRVVGGILKLFVRKPRRIINLAGELADKSIILVNHSAKMGPLALELHYPVFCAKWGAHEMMGGYKSRRNYLRDVFYIKKRGFRRSAATAKANFEAIFSKMIYRGMKMLPTFPDSRFRDTLKHSVAVLDSGASVMIFPEDSNEGYKTVLTSFFPGFVMLAERYHKLRGEDVPVYPAYYDLKSRIMVIGKPQSALELLASGKSRYEVAAHFCNEVNGLYYDYVLGSRPDEVSADTEGAAADAESGD